MYAYGASPMPLPLSRAALEARPNTDFIVPDEKWGEW
jgi:hypothetical protein